MEDANLLAIHAKRYTIGTSSWPAVSVERRQRLGQVQLHWSILVRISMLNVNCFYCYFVHSWGGCKSSQFTMYHMCKTWLQKVHGGWGMGGDFEIKIYIINSFSLFYFMSKMSKIHCMECNQLNGTHVGDVEDVLKYIYSSRTCILHRSVDV